MNIVLIKTEHYSSFDVAILTVGQHDLLSLIKKRARLITVRPCYLSAEASYYTLTENFKFFYVFYTVSKS